MATTISFKVLRDSIDGGEPTYVEYEVPYKPGMRILDGLLYIYEETDHSLAVRHSCKIGNCQVCLVNANGKTVYSCQEPLEASMTIGPVPKMLRIRDLATEFEV